MPRNIKKQTTAERLAEQDAKAQADEVTRIIAHTCELLDALLADARPHMPTTWTTPIIDRMRAFLQRRGLTAEDPAWITKMRRTVTGYTQRSNELRKKDDVFSLE